MISMWIEAILGHSVSINLKKVWVKQPCIYNTLVAHRTVGGETQYTYTGHIISYPPADRQIQQESNNIYLILEKHDKREGNDWENKSVKVSKVGAKRTH